MTLCLHENVVAEHSDVASISGRSIMNHDEIEMADNKLTNEGKNQSENNSDDESDGVNFISIKVTNSDGNNSELDAISPKAVQMAEPTPRSEDLHDQHLNYDHHPKIESPFHEFGKIFFLVFIWFLMIAFLTSTPEKKIEKRQMVVPKDDPKFYNLPQQPNGTLIHLTLQGPFLPDQKEYLRKPSSTSEDTRNKDNSLVIYLRTISEKILSPNKTFYICKPNEIYLVNASTVEFTFDIGEDNLYELNDEVVQAVIISNFSKASDYDKQEMPITLSVDFAPINKPIGLLFAAFTLILLYALIVWEVRIFFVFLL